MLSSAHRHGVVRTESAGAPEMGYWYRGTSLHWKTLDDARSTSAEHMNGGGKTMSQAMRDSRPRWRDLDWYRTMRDTEPVWRDPEPGIWQAFRYHDVATILADNQAFSSDFSQ